jgi:hypothetical protein
MTSERHFIYQRHVPLHETERHQRRRMDVTRLIMTY